MPIHPPRLRACALCLAALCAACDSEFAIQGLVTPGDNRPPIIVRPTLALEGSGLLELRATVFDPNGDALVLTYEQISGPFARQVSSLTVAGALNVKLEPAGAGLYAFRVRASDGFFEETADVSIELGDAGSGAPAAFRRIPEGRFDIHITGQVVADRQSQSFSLEGTLEIRTAPESHAGDNAAIVTLRTQASPHFGAAPPGALIVQSSTSNGGDLLVFDMSAGEVLLTAADGTRSREAGAVFRSAESGVSALEARAVLVAFRVDGDTITGEIFLDTSDIPTPDLPRFAEYAAQFTGSQN